jgi:FkbM family methyltransferase
MPFSNIKKLLYFFKHFIYIKFINKIIEPEQILLKRIKFKTCLDVGSHFGYYTQFLLNRSSKVISIDPLNYMIRFQKIIFFLTSKITFYNFALGVNNSTTNIYIPLANKFYNDSASSLIPSENTLKKKIYIKNGDKLLKENNEIDFIKIDVEGYELEVVKSLIKTIKNNNPTLLIEILPTKFSNTKKKDILKIFTKLKKLNYEIYYCEQVNRLKKINFNDIKREILSRNFNLKFKKSKQDQKKYKFLKSKKYIINYFFIPKKEIYISQIEIKKYYR